MKKLTPSEIAVLERLIFPETVDVIQEETELQFGEIRDALINLISFHLIEVVDKTLPEPAGTNFYDSDNLGDSRFRITKSGIKYIRQLS